jgi:unsaturated rhamnogalacturonyl hydrolase
MTTTHRSLALLRSQLLLVLLVAVALGCRTRSGPMQPNDVKSFATWPAGQSPAEIGTRVAENFVGYKLNYERDPNWRYIFYPETCAWYGSLTVAQLTGNDALKARLLQKFDPLLSTEARRIPANAHVDDRVFGAVPLEIYIQTRNETYLQIGKSIADKQWAKTTPDGITTEARYWIDDMYMISAVQSQAYRATGDATYLDRASLAMVAYLDKLQQPNGLFFHAPDAPFYWSRGNGWMAAGLTELLRALPADHPRRARILAGYHTMMASLLPYQGEDGLWRQLLDKPESWPESSGTGMFTFALITGVKNGWLDEKTYGPAARKGWLGLISYLDADANVREVCEGTNKGRTLKYYLDRKRKVGDLHGQAPILWCASALLRPAESAR